MKDKNKIIPLTKEMLLVLVKEAQNDKYFRLEDVRKEYQDINNLNDVDSIFLYLNDGYGSMLGNIQIYFDIFSGELLLKNIDSERFGKWKKELHYPIWYQGNAKIQFFGNDSCYKECIEQYLRKNNYTNSFIKKGQELASTIWNEILDKKIMTILELKFETNWSGIFNKELSNLRLIEHLRILLPKLKFILDNQLIKTKMVFNIEKQDIEFIEICEVNNEDYFLAITNFIIKYLYDKNLLEI